MNAVVPSPFGRGGPKAEPVRGSGPTGVPRHLVFECGSTAATPIHTGIQRVVRNIARHLPDHAAERGWQLRFVAFGEAGAVAVDPAALGARRVWLGDGAGPAETGRASDPPADKRDRKRRKRRRRRLSRLRALFDRARSRAADLLARLADRTVARRRHAGDVLLLIDPTWDRPVWAEVDRFRRRGGAVVGVVYDLIPLSHPHTTNNRVATSFAEAFAATTARADGLVCISRFVADCVNAHLDSHPTGLPRPNVTHFRLGTDPAPPAAREPPSGPVAAAFAGPVPTFLIVGSIEPRKRADLVLDAFEAVWAAGTDARLVFVGRQSWGMAAFLERAAAHAERGRRLFVFRDASDPDLDHAYAACAALIFASEIEGFGLPLVEAFVRGVDVIASDIPVFREIADGRAAFFPAGDAAALARLVAARTADPPPRRPPDPAAWIDWRASADELLDAVERVARPSA